MKRSQLLLLLAAALVLGGCAMGPDYQRPEVDLSPTFREHGGTGLEASFGDLGWRAVYRDPALQAFIVEALESAPDVLLAEARVREAEALAGVVRSDLMPRLGASLATSPIPRPDGDNLASNFTAGASVSWELDLWGRLRRADEAARADLLGTEEARRGVVVSLIGDVAARYYQLVSEHQALRVAGQTAAGQEESLRLIQRLAASGMASAAEVRQQEVALAVTRSSLVNLHRRIATSENGLSLLLGRVPGPIEVDLFSAGQLEVEIPAGLPSALLERRPDIRAAEQQLIAANARVGEAKARFFPTLSLTGLFGNIGTQLSEVLTGGAATVASLGANAVQPLFAGGQLYFNREAALARLDQALVGYRRTVLSALAEVATALKNYRETGELVVIQEQRVVAAREARRLAELRYRSGVISYIEVLDAQRQLFAAETEQVNSIYERRLAHSRIYLALGGGWEESPEAPAPGF
jgi:outer membrane protein, multidrug efflux system